MRAQIEFETDAALSQSIHTRTLTPRCQHAHAGASTFTGTSDPPDHPGGPGIDVLIYFSLTYVITLILATKEVYLYSVTTTKKPIPVPPR
jgi:hypothetical protein